MATNKQRGSDTSITRELESIRDSLAVPTQIPLLEDVVDNQQELSSRPTSPGKQSGKNNTGKTRRVRKVASARSEFKLSEASLKKIKSASDKIIDDLVKEYSTRMTAYIRKELNDQLENILKDMSSGTGSKPKKGV